jgi:hypothetical protein
MKEIKDGIISKEDYNATDVRILWVLKEGNVSKNDEDYTRDICKEILNNGHLINALKIPTFRKMIYATYGIMNNKTEWKNVPPANDVVAYNCLKKIAYININKMPGKGTANYNVIKNAYENYENLLLDQINNINPNIIIFGGTLHFFNCNKLKEIGWNLFDVKKQYFNESNKGKTTSFFPISKNKLIINAYHPAYVRISNYNYWLEIKTVYEKWNELYE